MGKHDRECAKVLLIMLRNIKRDIGYGFVAHTPLVPCFICVVKWVYPGNVEAAY